MGTIAAGGEKNSVRSEFAACRHQASCQQRHMVSSCCSGLWSAACVRSQRGTEDNRMLTCNNYWLAAAEYASSTGAGEALT